MDSLLQSLVNGNYIILNYMTYRRADCSGLTREFRYGVLTRYGVSILSFYTIEI